MTEKEKNVIMQELWALAAQDTEASKHFFEISSRQLKCITREEADEMTPNKHKVVEELKLQWNFIKTIHKDLGKIAEKTWERGTCAYTFRNLSSVTNCGIRKMAV